MSFPQELGPFGLVPCSCTAVGFGSGAAALRDPHGGPWSLNVHMLRAETFLALCPQLQNLELRGHFAPVHKITLPLDVRHAANIPDSAVWFTWSYPVSNRLAFTGAQLQANADLAFLTVGGYLYLDDSCAPVASKAVAQNAGGALRFAGPFRWQASWNDQLHQSRFQPVTVGVMRSAGALEFLWILPGEILAGQVPCPHGGFAYRMQDSVDIFFALTRDDPQPKDLQCKLSSDDELRWLANKTEAYRQAEMAAAKEADEKEEQLLSLQAEPMLSTRLWGFPHSNGPFGLVPCSCARLGLELGASALRSPQGGPWKLNVGVLQGEVLCAIASQLQGQELEGYFSPLHQVTLPPAARRAANIPDSAVWFTWSYPVVNKISLTSRQLQDFPDVSFLAIGGYVYLDSSFHVVAANALMPNDVPALEFEGPYNWQPEWTAQMGSRFRPVSLSALRSAGATKFCWILPGEVVGGQAICPHGGFAYRMSGNAPDVLFAITRSQPVHESCKFLSEEEQRQLEETADAARLAMDEAEAAAGGKAAMDQFKRVQGKRKKYEAAQKEQLLQKFLAEAGFDSVNEIRVVNHVSLACIRCMGFQYPLHAAVQSKDAGAIKLLLCAGADTTKKDSEGVTPLELAQKLNHRNSHARCIVALTQT